MTYLTFTGKEGCRYIVGILYLQAVYCCLRPDGWFAHASDAARYLRKTDAR